MRIPRRSQADSRDSSVRVADLERGVLRELCHATLTRTNWQNILRELRGYVWQDVEHGLVYAAIRPLRSLNPNALREQLPAQTTRMGFPDIDWKTYFTHEGENDPAHSAGQIIRLIRMLRRLVAQG
jgi:hypothetical protein